ncbi:kinase-like domain-containing protein [Cantharellus anzutake]|uniref:kinase-like domain-containing protein n=1 Tax=Cantharellus anzutake TaxID=1750568 RepID=UPI0019075F9B|nr:kinase-like domain-containing protein [Cantharellus anzutake]KAF8328934.1 kinase-like domain-containing protein [Cantharellus anzutake]
MKVWKDLKHPNIVEFIGYAIEHEVGGVTAALVSQWCANGNVVKYLEQNPAADREMLLNILINDTGRAQLCDFGLSRILDGLPTGQTTSDQGGTLRFLAPELLESSEEDSHPTTKSDVYAFGARRSELTVASRRFSLIIHHTIG